MCTATCIERQLGKSCVLCHNLFPTTLTFPLEHWKSLNFFFGFADDVRSKIAPCVSHGRRRRGLGVHAPNTMPPPLHLFLACYSDKQSFRNRNHLYNHSKEFFSVALYVLIHSIVSPQNFSTYLNYLCPFQMNYNVNN